MSIATTNPYANHEALTPLEADVLWEYAKLSATIKNIVELARETTENPNDALLEDLRELERKRKLVFTLLQTSVWLMTQEHLAAEEAAQQDEEEGDETVGGGGYDATRMEPYPFEDEDEGDSTVRY